MKKLNRYKGGIVIALLLATLIMGFKTDAPNISNNKKTVKDYMDGFNAGNHRKILACLTGDVIWEMPGVYYHTGKQAFDKEIENPAFVGRPVISITRMVEEAGIVVAEGTVHGKKKDGSQFDAVFCDVFHLQNGKIKKLSSYLMFKKP